MTAKIRLALVGRPNVGKSALFNRIINRRIAIVDEAEGITRDRLYADADYFGKPFEIIDTGGIDPFSGIPFYEEVRIQTEIAVEEADTIVMVTDGRAGVTALDEYVAKLLLKTGKRVIVAVNKIDDLLHTDSIYPFYSLGIKDVIGVSAIQGFQIAELLEAAFEGVDFPEESEPEEERIKVAVIGRPNAGKSTLVNYLLHESRCVVSPVAGTTRDSIDTFLEREGRSFTLIDTAGIRKKQAEKEAVDKFAAVRTERAIGRSDICILVMEAEQGMTAREKRIAEMIEEAGKGCILLFNKWDLVKGFRMEHCLRGIREEAGFLSHCPTLFASALTGRNLEELFSLLIKVYEEARVRISTGQLNKFVEEVFRKYHPPMLGGKRLRVYYMTQVSVAPPRFVLFVNDPKLMLETYKKYLIGQFREQYGFSGIPLIFELRGKGEKKEEIRIQEEGVAAAPEEEILDPDDVPDLQTEIDSSYDSDFSE